MYGYTGAGHLPAQRSAGLGAIEHQCDVCAAPLSPPVDDASHRLPPDVGNRGVRVHGVQQVVPVDDDVLFHGDQYGHSSSL